MRYKARGLRVSAFYTYAPYLAWFMSPIRKTFVLSNNSEVLYLYASTSFIGASIDTPM